MTNERDLGRELDEKPDEPTIIWKPAVGDKLIGGVCVVDQVTSRFDSALHLKLVVERDDDGKFVTVYGHHKVLAEKLAEAPPRVGDRIGIKRLQDSPKGYFRYDVLIERPGITEQETGPESEPRSMTSTTEHRSEPVAEDNDISFPFGANTTKAR